MGLINGLAPYEPNEWQKAAFENTSRLLLLEGAGGSGKSRCAAEKIHFYCMNYPKTTALVLRKTRESTRNSVVAFFQNEVFGNDPSINHKPSDYRFEYPNGSVIVYGGMKDKEQREAIKSIGQQGGVDIAWMEEATSFVNDDLDAVASRMRGRSGPFRQIILTCNPDGPFHWIKTRLMGMDKPNQVNGCMWNGKEATVFSPRPEDNPANPPDYIDWLKSLTGVAYARMYLGEWVQAEGMVYDIWDVKTHIIDPFTIPDSWKKFVAVDFGYKDPMVIQFWAIEPITKRLYLYREIYYTLRTVQEHCLTIAPFIESEGITKAVCDHDAENRAQFENSLRQYGITTISAKKQIKSGVNAMQKRLKPLSDGKPGMMVFRNCLYEEDMDLRKKHLPMGMEQEVYHYIWDDSARKGDKPVDKYNHSMDTARYAVMYVDDFNNVSVSSVSKVAQQLLNKRNASHQTANQKV